MTRRRVYFYDYKQNKLYSTPEFNGDKEEFVKFSKHEDSCDKNFDEILEEFEGVKTLEEFKNASNKAQSYYHSFLGDEILPIRETENITPNDEVYMLNKDGEIYLYNPQELNREYLINVTGKGKFKYEELTMKVDKEYSKYLKCNIYTLEIDAIENISTMNSFHLGAIEDTEVTANLEDFLKSKFDSYTKLVERMKKNLNGEPLKLELISSPNNNFTVGFQSEKGNKYVLSPRKDYCFELIKIDKSSREPCYALNSPIQIIGKTLSPIFDCWLGEPIYDLSQIDISRLEMAAKIHYYMAIQEDIFDVRSRNKNLNEIYKNIYNEENLNKYFFERYKDDEYINELKEEYCSFLNKNGNDLHIQNEEDEEEEM